MASKSTGRAIGLLSLGLSIAIIVCVSALTAYMKSGRACSTDLSAPLAPGCEIELGSRH